MIYVTTSSRSTAAIIEPIKESLGPSVRGLVSDTASAAIMVAAIITMLYGQYRAQMSLIFDQMHGAVGIVQVPVGNPKLSVESSPVAVLTIQLLNERDLRI